MSFLRLLQRRPLPRPIQPADAPQTPLIPSLASPIAHVLGPGKLSVDQGRILFTSGERRLLHLDPSSLRLLLCYGVISLTSDARNRLLEQGTAVAFLTSDGRKFLGVLQSWDSSRTLCRVLQYHALCRPATSLALARHHVRAKIQSQAAAVRHYQRQGKSDPQHALTRLTDALARIDAASSLDELRGIEGAASAAWFVMFAHVLHTPWAFDHRTRRPATDPVMRRKWVPR